MLSGCPSRPLACRGGPKKILRRRSKDMQTNNIAKRVSVLTALVVLLVAAAILIGCGTGASISNIPRFLVAPDQAAAPNVNVYKIDPTTGDLSVVATSPQDMTSTSPQTMV